MVYLTAGDPLTTCKELIKVLTASGVDLIELGIPTKNPKYDGPVIRASHKRAINAGITVEKAFSLIEETPARKVLLAYFDLALELGPKRFMESVSKSGVVSVLFPDLLIDYMDALDAYVKLCREYGLKPAFFVTSCFPHRLIAKLPSLNPSFIYLGLMASTGVLLPITVSKTIRIVKGLVGDVPLLTGFALSRPQQIVTCVKSGADGVVVGSAVLRHLEKFAGAEKLSKLKNYISELRKALNGDAS